MKVTYVEVEKMKAELAKPFRVAFGVITSCDTWTVIMHTDEGITGYGSDAPLAFVTGETMETCKIVLDTFAKAFVGQDPTDIEGAHKLMDSIIYANGAAKCAFDLACWDILGKYKNEPVYKLLGAPTNQVVTDYTIGIDAPEAMQKEAHRLVYDKGFDILKVKVGLNLDNDMDAIDRIRKEVGPNVRIRVDANQGYSVESALKALKVFEQYGVDAIEQCRPWWDFDGAAEIHQKNTTSVKLMLDESIHNHYDAERAGKMGCADYFNIKLMKCGGLYDGVKIAQTAQKYGVKCMVGCMQENKISIAAAVALVAAMPAIVEADCDSFMFYKNEDDGVKGGFTREGGKLTLLDKPGLGVEL